MFRTGSSCISALVLTLAVGAAVFMVSRLATAQEDEQIEAAPQTEAAQTETPQQQAAVAEESVKQAQAEKASDSDKGDSVIGDQPAEAAKELAKESTFANVVPLLVAIALFIVPMFIGGWLAKRLRMPNYGWKFALAIGTIAAAIVVVSTGEIKLGPDLSGGITLIYELDPEALEESNESSDVTVSRMITALTERIDPSGTKEVTIRKYGEGQVEIIIPKAEQAEMKSIEKNIVTGGNLEFRITASEKFSKQKVIIDAARRLPPGETIVTFDGDKVAQWVPYRVDGPIGSDNEGRYVKRVAGDVPQALVLTNDMQNVTGGDLEESKAGTDPMTPAVMFTMKPEGARKFGILTGTHLKNAAGAEYQLGIILDGTLISAPSIKSRIRSQGEITGLRDQEEVEFLVSILNAGSLPAKLNKTPISKESISPTLGKETIQKGEIAIVASLLAVIVFMLFYYRFAGFVACIALAANLLLILGAMVFISGAFTLPGLAGLVLTVGMSVDANVLIFERIREEQQRGAALRMAIRNGFARATQTIVDANITTLITAIVIYKIAPDSVKGFGVTLILGILMSMYTAIFLSRLIFDVADKLKWMKKLSMAQAVRDTAIDFLGKRGVAYTFSAILIAIGLFGIYGRGSDLLNIDFTGGSSVTMVLNDGSKMNFSDVKAELDETPLKEKNLSIVEVGDTNTRYRVTSIEQNVDEVQAIISEKFGDRLKHFHVDLEQVKPVGSSDQAAATFPAGQRLASLDMLNAAPVSSLFLLQADDATEAAKSAAPAADEAKPEATTPEKPKPEEPKPEEGKPETKAASELSKPQSDETAEPASAAADSKEKAAPEKSSENAKSGFGGASDPFVGGSAARLIFSSGAAETDDEEEGGVNYDTLYQLVSNAMQAAGHEGVAIGLSTPDEANASNTARAFRQWDVKLALPESEAREVLADLQAKTNGQAVFPLANKIGGRVAGRMTTDAISAIAISLLGIIAYVWFRFQRVMYGLAAVIALVHDVLVTLGIVALSGYLVSAVPGLAQALMVDKFQISLPLVAAILTIIGYSLNDTIVVFDRIREVKGKSPSLTQEMINVSINQTLSRTLLTSLTTLLTVVVLYIWGGDGIHGFAFALVIGVIVGTYSSIFIASPALLWMSNRAETSKPGAAGRAA